MLAHYVLQPELRHNMDYLAEIYLHYQTIHIDELIGAKGKNQKEHARPSAGRRIPLRLRRCGRYTETEERTRKRTERARCRTSLLRNRDAARTGARQHRKQRSAYRYGSA